MEAKSQKISDAALEKANQFLNEEADRLQEEILEPFLRGAPKEIREKYAVPPEKHGLKEKDSDDLPKIQR